MDVHLFTVGQLQENSFLVRASESATEAVIVDPGDEADRLLAAARELGVTITAILLTHTHFDHIGAVAAIARATGAPVYCPELELPVMRDPGAFYPPMFGPIEGWDPEETVSGGETLALAGLDIEVVFTPGHSPGHVTYAIADGLFSGDVLFQNSVGRVDLPGGDGRTLLASIALLLERYDDDTRVHPGHMGLTTLGAERRTNPFLTELAHK
jgi:hydroxyacylglutathione hydrolase